jgi:uncharacterized protein YcbK (DUF882 family)
LKRDAAVFFGGMVRAGSAAALCVALASCTTTAVPDLNVVSPSYAPASTTTMAAAATTELASADSADTVGTSADVAVEGSLPQTIAYLPTPNPRTLSGDAALATAAKPGVAPAGLTATAPGEVAPETEIRLAAMESAPRPLAASATATDIPPPPRPEAVLTADHSREAVLENPAPAAPRKPKSGFFASFFGSPKSAPEPKPVVRRLDNREATPVVLASAGPNAGVSLREALTGAELPGVRKSDLFDIKRKSGIDDDDDVDLTEDNDQPMRLASAAGLARLAPNGLMIQHEGVETACLRPELVKRLRLIERHYGKRVVITSGYRSPEHNRRVRGARKSLHMACAAADIQIPGIGKWELASYLRTMPNRGGVGTYCHTESVHVDVGPERDWNWRCRRSKKK